jgi:hypothetical protein
VKLSPRTFVVWALVIALAFGFAHAVGWREETRFLSGTPASVLQGLVYALLYFAFVLIAPTLVIAGGILAVLERLGCVRREEVPHA